MLLHAHPAALWRMISSAACVLVLASSLIAGLGMPGPATPAQLPGPCGDNARVVPGMSVGPLRLGMPLAEGGRLLGTPPMPMRKGTIAGATWEEWEFFPRTDLGLLAKDSAVVRITVGPGTPDTRGCVTPEGIRLGSPASALQASYGPPDGASILQNRDGSQIMAIWVYDTRGFQVMLDSVNRVGVFEIFAPGAFCGLQESLRALGWEGIDCASLTPPLSSAGPTPAGPTQASRPKPTQAAPLRAADRIVFVSNRDGSDQIYVLTTAGVARLTSPPGVSWSPAFSPDGQKIAFNTKHNGDWQIFTMDADGSHTTQLTAPPGSNVAPRFSPDGRQVAFTSSRGGLFQIFTMNVDGSNVSQLTFPPGANLGSSFSPDGRHIAFQSTRDGPFQIYVMNVDGSNSRRLTAPPGTADSPAFSPDGRKIVFDSDRDGAPQIYIMDADGSNVVRLTSGSGKSLAPSFSPDGTKIIFASTRDGSEQVYMMDPDGSNVVPLTTGPGQSFFPVFAP